MINYDSILSDNVKSLSPSAIRRFFDILEEMDDAISLGIGEPDFVTPWHIRDAGIRSLERGFTKYTGNAGLSRLREAIAEYLTRRFDLCYDPKTQMIVTVGGSEAIDLAVRALVNPGDEVIIPVPSFVCYGPITQLAGGTPVYIETKVENEFRLTADELRAAITPKTKLLILPFPNNPTGAILERAHLEAIAEVLRGTDIMVVTDEIYAELTYGRRHISLASLDGMYERCVVVNGFSKSHAMTGWRMGYVCAPAELVTQMLKIHQYAIMSAPTTSQYAAIEAMNEGDDDINLMRRDYDRRRRLLLDGLREIGIDCFEPHGAFYVFPYIGKFGLQSGEFCEKFLIEERVAIIPGTAFGPGGEGFARLCYASSIENIEEAVRRLGKFINRL
ncbi:MAG: aminotransferase class I/II-fold pyridoxal phosphate-dependent enzyme [Oscillospiraceae bacterium]|jgi:aminotransferase|nr:aminotransferase class I/II-fold pyridoxal phosphate-dependent enzyme [Oscillospiraceae bacterium]